MAFADDIADDYLMFDGLEAVTLKSSFRSGAPVSVSVASALRRYLTKEDRRNTGGVYRGDDLKWLIPQTLLADAGYAPKPGDRVVDSAGDEWTVLNAEKRTLGTMWWLVCRNRVISDQLFEPIRIETPAYSQAPTGLRVKTWATKYELRGRVQFLSSDAATVFGVRGQAAQYEVTVEEPLDKPLFVGVDDRLVRQDGSILSIEGFREAERIDELPLILARDPIR